MWDMETKVANNGVTNAGKHKASEYNNRQLELEKAVTHTGIALTAKPADPDATPDANTEMLAESMSRAASKAIFGTDSGSANTYVVSAVPNLIEPKALFDGMRVLFVPSSTNTGASTVNVFGLGAKAIRTYAGTAVSSGAITDGEPIEIIYDSTANGGAGAWLILPWTSQTADFSLWITANTTITVASSGGDYTSIQAALDSLDQKLIAPGVKVTISVASGTYNITSPIIVQHIHGHQIEIVGGSLSGTWPIGESATKSTMDANAAARFSTTLNVTAGVIGIEVKTAIGGIRNLFLKSTVSGASVGVMIGRSLLPASGGLASHGKQVTAVLDQVYCSGFSVGISVRGNSNAYLFNSGAGHCTKGITASGGSGLIATSPLASYCTQDGIVSEGSSVNIQTRVTAQHNDRYNIYAVHGGAINCTLNADTAANNVRATATGSYALAAFYASSITINDSNLNPSGGSGSSLSHSGSFVRIDGCVNVSGLSPAANTVGNHNSYNHQL